MKNLLLFVLLTFITAACSECKDEHSYNLEKIGSVKRKHSTDIDSSPWGIQAGTLQPEILDKAAEIGVKWTRLGISWQSVEKVENKYDWDETDKAFEAALSRGITPFVTLDGSNKLYSRPIKNKDPKLLAIYGQNPAPPTRNSRAFEAWLRFVESAVRRYKGKIKYWEVWNEPNHHHYWGAKPDGKDYGKLLDATAKLIKNIQPESFVIAGSMAGIDPKFTEDFLSTAEAANIDIITYHNYGAIPEERVYKAIELWRVINKHKPEIELWQGECGYPSHSSSRDYRGVSPWGPKIQAKWLLRQAFVDVYFCRASLSNYFKLFHKGGRGLMPERRTVLTKLDSLFGFPEREGSRVKSVGVNEKCLLSNPDLKPKPGYYAYSNLCAIWDESYRRIDRLDAKVSILEEGVFYGIGPEDDAFPSVPLKAAFISDGGNALLAYWLPWHPLELINPALVSINVKQPDFSEPVLIDLLDGSVYDLSASFNKDDSKFTRVPLTDYPLIIAERSSLKLDGDFD